MHSALGSWIILLKTNGERVQQDSLFHLVLPTKKVSFRFRGSLPETSAVSLRLCFAAVSTPSSCPRRAARQEPLLVTSR